jgi:hypothetical protein
MSDVETSTDVQKTSDIGESVAEKLLARYAIDTQWLPDGEDIPGSFWGAPEAGILGTRIYLRQDTPVHSMLHEASHIVCMDPAIRSVHAGNASSDDLEEAAVCYLQILLAAELPGVGSGRLMQDMDTWGYSFRLGNTRRWFELDASDAADWLREKGIVTADDELTWRLRMV